eukprot:12700308-Prorocentrum_lima.AAC.1
MIDRLLLPPLPPSDWTMHGNSRLPQQRHIHSKACAPGPRIAADGGDGSALAQDGNGGGKLLMT